MDELKTLSHVQSTLTEMALRFGPKALVAIVVLVAGLAAGRWLGQATDRGLKRFALEPPVRQLLVRLVRVLVLGLFAIMALQNLGVELLPLIAGLGVAGAGLALATQGVLSNVVAGLTIIFTKPYRVGESIAIVGVEGTVEAITLFNTVLLHADPVRLGEDDGEARYHVAQNPLRGQRETGAGHAEASDQRQQFHPQVLQRQDQEEAQHQHAHQAHQQLARRRFQLDAQQRAVGGPGHHAPDHQAGDQEQQCHDQFGAEPHGHFRHRALYVAQALDLVVHSAS